MAYSSSSRHMAWELFGWAFLVASLGLATMRFIDFQRSAGDPGGRPAVAAVIPVTTSEPAESPSAVPQPSSDGVELRADSNGHFQSDIEVNGRSVPVLVDTGATMVVLTYEDAERAGVFLRRDDFTLRMQTANGLSRAAPVTLERVAVGNIMVRDVEAAVAEPGVLRTNLLGMSFLRRLHRFEMHSGRLVLQD